MAQATLTQAVKAAGYGGWDFDEPVEKIQYIPSNIPGEKPTAQPTGIYTVNVTDPTGKFNKQIELRKAPHAPGTGQEGPGGGWIVAEAPDLPKPTDANNTQTWTDPGTGALLERNPTTGEWAVKVAGDAAKSGRSAAELAAIEAKNADIARNEARGLGSLTSEQWQQLEIQRQSGTVSADTLKQRKAEFEQTNRIAQDQEKRLAATAGAQIDLTKAQTAGTGVETAMNEQRLKDLIAAAPDDATKRRLSNELIELQKQQAEQALKKPTIEQLGTGPTYGVIGPEGTIEERFRQGYVPKTLAEVQARTSQIDALAKQKEQEILQKYKDNPQAGYEEFQKWHAVNVQPHIAGLEAAGQEAAITRGKEIATMRTAAQTAALGAGAQQLDVFKAQAGPGFAEEYGKLLAASAGGKRPEGVDYTKMLTRPDVGPQVQQATAEALKYIDPTAAQMTGAGQPQWQQQNPADVLGMTRYMAGGGPPPAAGPAAGPGPAGPAPGMAPNLFHATPIMTTPEGTTQWQYPAAPPDEAYMAQQAAAQQAELDAQTSADLQALMAQQQQNDVYAYGGQPTVQPVRLPALRARVPTPVDRSTPFVQQALAAGLGAGGLGPMGPGPQTPIYDPAAEGVPVRPIWSPGGYVPPGYQYGGQYATPSPY